MATMNMEQATTPNRPRTSSRGLSFASHKSSGSKNELKQVESPKDKARRDSLYKGASKANPNAAIIESQPADANLREESTLLNLREQQHTDAYGNPIVDPDLSNPTRPRLERPLDTIRSFEKAIDDGYKRRSTYKPEPEPYDQNNQFASRRSSYFGGYDNGPSPNRYSQQQGGYYGNQNGGGQQRARHGNRGQSDPQFYGQQRPYQQPQHNYHQSHDTVNTNGSDSTGPWASNTDPSSENSSLDRVNAMNKSPADVYAAYNQAQGQNGGYNGPIMEEQGQGSYGEYPYQRGYGGQSQPPQQGDGFRGPRDGYPRHNTAPSEPRRPMQLNSGPPPPDHLPAPTRAPDAEKKKGWLSRKFSKKN